MHINFQAEAKLDWSLDAIQIDLKYLVHLIDGLLAFIQLDEQNNLRVWNSQLSRCANAKEAEPRPNHCN